MKSARLWILSLIALLLLWSPVAWAHRPLPFGGSYSDPEHALQIEEIEISQVVYYEISSRLPQLWLTFEAREGQELYLQLGLPVIERLKEFRPALAVLGPGLPEVTLPFEVPQGLGGQVFETGELSEPEVFHEPFTDTYSWILGGLELSLPAAGRYYVAAYAPSGATGKLWVAVGRREAFGLTDIIGLPTVIAQVRRFHEVEGGTGWMKVAVVLIGVVLLALALWWLIIR